jgi:hypothetical protein
MRPLVVAVLACACLLAAAPAGADAPTTDAQAHQAYERGTAAYRRRDYATAAREYAAADALSPNPTALQAAIDATIQGDDPVLGLQLLERARGAPRTSALLSTMLVAEKKFAHRTGRIAIACPAQPCLATVDGAAIDPSQPTLVRVGAHTVMIESGGSTTTRTLTVAPDETETMTASSASSSSSSTPPPAPAPSPSTSAPPPTLPSPAPASPPAPAPPPADATGLSPVWLFATLGATAIAGGFTIASGIDTSNKSSAFSSAHCGAPAPPAGCDQVSQDGQSAQTRTNVLIGVTAALGLASAALVPFVRWHHLTAAVTAGGLAFDARF